jgi:hypothetical protein
VEVDVAEEEAEEFDAAVACAYVAGLLFFYAEAFTSMEGVSLVRMRHRRSRQ